jgi:hypothetical protein
MNRKQAAEQVHNGIIKSRKKINNRLILRPVQIDLQA